MKKNKLYQFLFLACLSGTLSFAGCDLFEDSELEPATTNNGGSGNNNNSNNNGGNNNNNGGNGNNNGGGGNNHGGATFWCNSKDDAGAWIKFDGRFPQQIAYYFPDNVPDCDDKGTISFYEPSGDYQYEIYWLKSDGRTKEQKQKGVLTITRRGCTKIMVQKH